MLMEATSGTFTCLFLLNNYAFIDMISISASYAGKSQ